MQRIFGGLFYLLSGWSLLYGTAFHITADDSLTVWDANQASVSGDTIILHIPVTDKVDVERKTLYFIGIDTVPRITWTGQISSEYGALECENATVTIRNINFVGATGGYGSSYCGYNTCGNCSQGGDGGQGLILRNTHAVIENCEFTGGTEGKGGMSGSKGCYACDCSPCIYCPDGSRGTGLIVCDNSRADTLNVSIESDSLDSTSGMYRFDPTSVNELRPPRTPAGASLPAGVCAVYDLRGRKLHASDRRFGKGTGPAGGILIARNTSSKTWVLLMPGR